MNHKDIELISLEMTSREQTRLAAMELANERYLRGNLKRRRYEAEKARKRFINVILADREDGSTCSGREAS